MPSSWLSRLCSQFGFLIHLDKRQHKFDEATQQFEDIPPDFNFIFMQDDDAFFKNAEMAQLDEQFGDLEAYIKDTESMIVSELEDDILDCETDLRETFGALAELDCILSFANCASDLDFVRPTVIDASEKIINITNGRHPLQELIIDTEFIPNDTQINIQHRVHVVTGPNFSGKSCYTRQVGILVYMAHIGCFLPCECATISITDQILARINTVETCAVPQSSFQLDLTQMGTILRRSTPFSLVLIDEFGKGKYQQRYFLLLHQHPISTLASNTALHVGRDESSVWNSGPHSSPTEIGKTGMQGHLYNTFLGDFLTGLAAKRCRRHSSTPHGHPSPGLQRTRWCHTSLPA